VEQKKRSKMENVYQEIENCSTPNMRRIKPAEINWTSINKRIRIRIVKLKIH
jgi:hypothetical protein